MSPRSISLIVLTGLIACLGLAFLRVVQPFLLPLMLAAVTAMLLQPLLRYFLCRTGNRRALAAALTTLTMLGAVLLPLLVGIILGVTQLYDWSSDMLTNTGSEDAYHRMYEELHVRKLLERLQPYLHPDGKPEDMEQWALDMVKKKENLPKLLESVANQTLGLAASTFGLLGSLVSLALTLSVFVTAVYFFLADGPHLLEATQCMLPVQREHQDRLLDQFVKVTRAVVIGTFAAAVAQGIATGIGLYFAGIERVMLLTVIATVVAIVPMAGTSLVWIPCAIWMCFSRESWVYPVILFSLYNAFIVASLDNLVRSYVLNSDVKLHPLLAFISVLGGLQWLGLWGVFVGPVIASCLYAMVTIINEELAIYGQQAGKSNATAAAAAEVTAAVMSSVAEPPAAVTPAGKPSQTKPPVRRTRVRNKRR